MKKSKLDISIIILIIVLAIYSVLCLTKHQYVRMTADSMLYFSIAQKYLAGDFHNAVNGYWGPLLAWLIVPFMYFGVSDVLTINILNLIFGVLAFIGIWRLSYRFEISERIRAILIITSFPIVLRFSLVQPMDFLLVCILVFYLVIVFHSDYSKKITSGLLSGTLGALAYFTKAYAFPFFIVHFFIMNVFHYFRNIANEYRKKVFKNAVAGFALFFLMSGTWIMLIGDKYGHFTYSTMRDTNFNAPGPDVVGGGLEFGVPVFTEGFFAPPNKTAFVVWEDPSYLRGTPWSPWQSYRHFKHFMRLTLKNVSDGLQMFEAFSTLSIVILIAYLLLLSARHLKEWLDQITLLYPLFTIVLFSGGYLLFHLEERYLWLSNILLLLMGGYVLYEILQKEFFEANMRKNIIIIFFILSFIFTPSKYVVQAGRGGMDTFMHDVSTDLKHFNIKGNLASNREHLPIHDAWHKTFRLAYWLDSIYYGQERFGISDNELIADLKKFDIDYYFLWGEDERIPRFLDRFQEVTGGIIPGLKVFSLKLGDLSGDSGRMKE